MNKFFVLVKKEIKELITIEMILPLLIMILVFSMIGNVISKETKKAAAPQPLWVVNEDDSQAAKDMIDALEKFNYNIVLFNDGVDSVLKEAKQKNVSNILVIPAGFGDGIKNFQPQKLKIYNLINSYALSAATKGQATAGAVAIVNRYFIDDWLKKNNVQIPVDSFTNPVGVEEFAVINGKQAQIPLAQVMNFISRQTTFIPIVLFMVIIFSAQMVASTVASEKENKTFETLLSSPINRKTIIIAKLFSAGLVAILFAGFYMVGFNSYLKGIYGGLSSPGGQATSQALTSLGIVFGPGSYILLGLSLFMGILVALAIAIILGILVENVKNVQAVITPLMVLVLLPYLLTLLVDINSLSPVFKYAMYIIPFTHPFLAAQKIITHDYLFILYGIIYQLIIFLVFVVIAAKIFSSDKIFTLRLGRKKQS